MLLLFYHSLTHNKRLYVMNIVDTAMKLAFLAEIVDSNLWAKVGASRHVERTDRRKERTKRAFLLPVH